MILVPPWALKITKEALDLVNDKYKAKSFEAYATLNRECAVIVDDEVVAGDLLVAACRVLEITYIQVHVEYGNPDHIRREYANSGAANGAPIQS